MIAARGIIDQVLDDCILQANAPLPTVLVHGHATIQGLLEHLTYRSCASRPAARITALPRLEPRRDRRSAKSNLIIAGGSFGVAAIH